jgi:hypothetical protein
MGINKLPRYIGPSPDEESVGMLDAYMTWGSGVEAPTFSGSLAGLTTNTESLQVWANGTTGDDSNDGLTEATPKKTIKEVLNLLPDVLSYSCTVNLRGVFDWTSISSLDLIVQKSLLQAILVIDGGPETEVLEGPFTATSASTSSITDSARTWTADAYSGLFVEILDGPAAGETRSIYSHDGTTLTPISNWSVSPGAGASFQISQPATTFTSSGSSRDLIMSCTPLNTFQNYPALQRITFKGNTALFHVGGALVMGGVVSRATGGTSFRFESVGNVFPISFYTSPTTYGFEFVERTVTSFVGTGSTEMNKESGILTNGGFILNGGSLVIDDSSISGAGSIFSRIINGSITIQNSIGNCLFQVSGSTGAGLTLVNSNISVSSLQIDDCGSHAIEVNKSKLTHSSGTITGSGNTGAGVYVHSQGIVHTKSGSAPTITGTVGEVSLDAISQESTWAAIEAGTPINGATVGNDEFVIVKKV